MENINLKTIGIEGVNINDYPDFCDAFVSYAEDNDGNELDDSELNELNENHSSIINEIIHENQLYF